MKLYGDMLFGNRLMVFIICVICILVLVSIIGGCSIAQKPVEKEQYLMGTIVQVKAYGKNAEAAAEKALDRVRELEGKMTLNAPESEIIRLNTLAGRERVQVSEDTFRVMEKALLYAQLSEGAFDPTVGPLVKLWGIGTEQARVPSADEVNGTIPLVGYKKLKLFSDNGYFAELAQPGQIVDLGGIAKGYAGDEMIKVLKSQGIKSAFVNLGGNVVAMGSKPDGTPWKIGVQNPRDELRGNYIGILNVTDKTVVSSGDYERFFENNGVRYHHILNPKTGYPADSGLISTTIVSDSSVDADGLSTSTFVLGLDKGMALINSLPGVEAIFITKDKKVYVTPGLSEDFKLTNGEYIYEER